MNLINNTSKEALIDDQIRRFIRESGIPLGTFAEAVGWKSYQAMEWWACRGQSLNYRNLESLAQFLGVSAENLVEGRYHINLIRKRIFKGPGVLPERYSEHASSYVRTLAHIIEYLSMLYGRHFTDRLLRDLNIHPLFFDNLENKISVTFYTDIFNKLSQMGVKDNEIASLACYIFLSLRDTKFGQKFRDAKNYQEFYALLGENAEKFETNFDYEVLVDSERVRIYAKPTDATSYLLGKSLGEFDRLFLYRKNVLGWFPTLSHLPPIIMKTPKCILKGDPYTLYEAKLPKNFNEESANRLNLQLLRSL